MPPGKQVVRMSVENAELYRKLAAARQEVARAKQNAACSATLPGGGEARDIPLYPAPGDTGGPTAPIRPFLRVLGKWSAIEQARAVDIHLDSATALVAPAHYSADSTSRFADARRRCRSRQRWSRRRGEGPRERRCLRRPLRCTR
jgi:hypothetical protein